MEDNVNLLPDDCDDLVLEEEDLNLEKDRHEESLPSTKIGKETNPEAEADWRLLKTKEKMWSYAQAEMEQLQAQQGENCSTSDPISVVMPKEHTGHVRLVGKGVTKSDLKASSSSTSIVIDGITVKVPVDFVKSIITSVKTELTQEILSTILINLQRVIPNLDSDSILAGLAAGIQSPGDAVSGHGTRNASSSFPTYTPSFNQ
ncbi:hypothetical protein Dimus_003860, partial [Dionaea muscipula]